MATLTREYLENHMSGAAISAAEGPIDSPGAFADALIDRVLAMAADQSPTDGADQLDFNLPITLRPVANAPQGGCIEVCIGIGIASVCYHRGFKGSRPGKG